jgi:hypothetical protein
MAGAGTTGITATIRALVCTSITVTVTIGIGVVTVIGTESSWAGLRPARPALRPRNGERSHAVVVADRSAGVPVRGGYGGLPYDRRDRRAHLHARPCHRYAGVGAKAGGRRSSRNRLRLQSPQWPRGNVRRLHRGDRRKQGAAGDSSDALVGTRASGHEAHAWRTPTGLCSRQGCSTGSTGPAPRRPQQRDDAPYDGRQARGQRIEGKTTSAAVPCFGDPAGPPGKYELSSFIPRSRNRDRIAAVDTCVRGLRRNIKRSRQ